ncbi:MAG: histidine--tRNA ligase [Patescibacteria group bacterium]|nr:histidine--tRNA ligase [Patescibacteria group bacterium]MCL5093620.1 histidine--tRNA ligase [Patescibacteria group bacterium]
MAKKTFQTVRGTRDLLPKDNKYFDFIFDQYVSEAKNAGFSKIETPMFEDTNLFVRGVGRETDIVEKEMYTFKDKSGNSITLRPEGTAPIVRAYLEDGMQAWPQPVSLYYSSPMFRYDRPQAGRYREFYQFGVEVIGSMSPLIDVSLISMSWRVLEKIGLKDITLQVNSIGCPSCRPKYRRMLSAYITDNAKKLCKNCLKRSKTNPLRVLDCKEKVCRLLMEDAPILINNLCTECHNHFKEVLEWLDDLEIPYELNTKLVRGLDYYTKTVFEIWTKSQGAQNSLGGGGRYDELVETMGGKATPAIGFAMGIDRIVELMKEQEIQLPEERLAEVYVVQLGDEAKKKGFKLLNELQKSGIRTQGGLDKDGISEQLKIASNLGAVYSVIIGQKEAMSGTAIIKEMSSGNQEVVAIEKVVKELIKRLKD